MSTIPYDASRKSLFHPGDSDNFFKLGTIQNDAALCAEMSRLAYVKDENLLAQYLNRAGFQKDLAIGYGSLGTQAFVASKQSDNLSVVSFRGTEPDDPSDLFTDANFIMTSWTDNSGQSLGKVHEGFAAALLANDILKKIITCLDSLAPATRVLITGHSLGAALATLAASLKPSSRLYTFGSCRVGDAAFAKAVSSIIHDRFVDCCDLVTRVPAEEFGYVHVGSLKYIDRNGKLLASPNEETIDADRLKATAWYLVRHAFLPGTVFSRDLADHAPINYVSGVMGLRASAG
ncbi:MAG: lipase family protein [Methylococcales bacterium]|nr:lipase family protein [Methylococcales bacterium]